MRALHISRLAFAGALILAAEHQAQRLGELLGSLAQAARDQATMGLRVEGGRARTRTAAPPASSSRTRSPVSGSSRPACR